MKLNKVLVPIDASGFCLEVLPHITHLLEPEKTELFLLHVAPAPDSVVVDERVVIYADQVTASLEEECKDAIQPYVQSLQELGYHVTPIVTFGDPAKQIEAFVESKEVDMVAMATHGRTGIQRLLHGSVAQHVFQHVDVPVLLYRSFAEDEADDVIPSK